MAHMRQAVGEAKVASTTPGHYSILLVLRRGLDPVFKPVRGTWTKYRVAVKEI